nr:hypothetical protein [Tanacetum cinerariifolium]
QNVRNQVAQNPRVQNVGNQNGLIGVQRNGNQNQIRNGNFVVVRAEGNTTGQNRNQIRCYNYKGKEEAGIQLQAEEYDLMAAAADLDEIEEVNANYILMANLQQASTSGTQTDSAPVYDSDGSAEVHENCDTNEIFNMFTQEEQYTELLEPIPEPQQVPQNDNNIIFEVTDVEQAKFVGDFKSLAKKADDSLAKHKALELEIERLLKAVVSQDIISVVQNASVVDTSVLQTELEPYKDMQQKIERLQAQLGDLKGKSKDTSCVSDTLNPLSQKLENENVELEFQDNTCDTSENTKFAKQSTEETLPKLDEIHALSKPVTSNSVSTPQESKGVDNTKTRRPQPRSNTKNDRVPSASKSSRSTNKEAEVEEHHMNLLLSKNNEHISSACNNIKIDSPDVISKKQKAKVSFKETQMKYQPKATKPKKVGFLERLAIPKPRKSRLLLRWLPTGRLFDPKGKIVDSSESESHSDYSNGNLKLLINFVWKFMGTVRFGNDHVAVILDFDLEVAFRRNACFVRNLEGVDLLKGDRSKNLYTINLCEMASASPICLMAHASSTKSWLWHQRLSHLNFDTINDLARNDLVSGLPKFKYLKEHLCPSCEQGKSKRASHPPKPVPNSRQRLHLLHMDLCGPIRIASINEKRYVLVIVDDYSRYTWAHFLRSKDEAPEVIIKFLKRITNDREDIRKLGAKGDIGFFIGYSVDSCTYRVYNHRTKKIMETMNVSFDELSAMAFEQRSSKLGLQTMYNDYISGRPSATVENVLTAKEPQDHPLEQVIGEPLRPVLTRNQLRSNGDMCMHALTVSTMEPKNVKEAMTDPAWIESMKEELLQFKRMDVKPTEKHLKEVKRIFRYLRGTVNTGLWYTKDSGFELTGFSDADYAGCKDTFKSTSGGAQFLGEKLVSWSSKKQDCTALSTEEAKYVSLSACCAQVLWMQTQLTDYGFNFKKIPIYCDSKSAIAISCNPVQHSRTKHIAVPRAGGIYTGTLPRDRVEVLGSVDGITTSFQRSQNSRPPCSIIKDKYMMKAQVHVSKSSEISGVQALLQKKHYS